MCTRTSPGPGGATVTSSMVSGAAASQATAARQTMGLPAVPDIARDTIAGTERAARVDKDMARESIVVAGCDGAGGGCVAGVAGLHTGEQSGSSGHGDATAFVAEHTRNLKPPPSPTARPHCQQNAHTQRPQPQRRLTSGTHASNTKTALVLSLILSAAPSRNLKDRQASSSSHLSHVAPCTQSASAGACVVCGVLWHTTSMAAVQTVVSKDVSAAIGAVGGADVLSDSGFQEVVHAAFASLTDDSADASAVLSCMYALWARWKAYVLCVRSPPGLATSVNTPGWRASSSCEVFLRGLEHRCPREHTPWPGARSRCVRGVATPLYRMCERGDVRRLTWAVMRVQGVAAGVWLAAGSSSVCGESLCGAREGAACAVV